MLYNFSTKPFTYTWGRIPYTFLPGEFYSGIIISDDRAHSVELNEVVSGFFAQHLAEWVLNTPEMNVNFTEGLDGKAKGTDGFPAKYNMTSIELLKMRAMTIPDVETVLPKFIDELPVSEKHQVKKPVVIEAVETPIVEVIEPEVQKKPVGRSPKKQEFDI